ncbi:hypothetical protein [Pseudalkalibacillus decolorationis]|uniref:hypothetical protein n=1 Tax=Pseudalkalibacillus decolorationis TaxID=163879 RepID=UPI002147E9E7|nr:hypothetical protein [Pseudalkalibacillus decolorationis]
MKIYSRDYCSLTMKEKDEWNILREREVIHKIGDGDLAIRKSLYREYPVAVRHYLSLFPNNHLDIVDLRNTEYLSNNVELFYSLINSPSKMNVIF